ncbi:MAG TPA: neuraminidase-like domain-containing protein, partial [Pyrinomonadaceae bacterium]
QRQRQAGQWSSLRDLARLDIDDWVNLIKGVAGKGKDSLPAGISGKELPEKIQNFATVIASEVERQFPTTVIAHRLSRDDGFALPHKQDVLTFLNSQQDFELGTTHIKTYLLEKGETALQGIKDAQGLTTQLETMQRVAHVAPRYEQARALLTQGIVSAHSITQKSPEQFVDQFAQALGGAENAMEVYQAAEQKAATATNILVDFRTALSGIDLHVLSGSAPAMKDIPNLQTLFGSIDYCACNECRSVLSPAAYLVDVLEFLRQRSSPTSDGSVLDLLFARRPDLGEIELTCENTNTKVPYIDLVNEILENAVEPAVLPADWQRPPLTPEKHEQFQTRLSEEELSVYPEHINANAYAQLRRAVYPWTLPFDLWMEETRAYLGHLNTTRAALIEAFRPPASPGDSSAIEIARDTLGLPAATWDIIINQSTSGVREFWGQPPRLPLENLSIVRTFLSRSGLTHAELTELLKTRFINPNLPTQAVTIEPATSCALDEMRLTGLTDEVLNKVHRFIRLWRILGWTMRDLDIAIRVLGGGTLDLNCLLRLSDLMRVKAALNLSLPQILSFWAQLERDGSNSLYNSVFWNPVLRSQFTDSAFDPARLAVAGDSLPGISEHTQPIIAALAITPRELETLLRALNPPLSPDARADAALTLTNLSFLYRHLLLSRALHLSIDELLALKTLSGIDPFNPASTGNTLRFIELADTVHASDFSLSELVYLFLIPAGGVSPLAPSAEKVVRFVDDLRESLRKVRDDSVITPDPEGAQTRRFLSLINWSPAVIDQLVRTLTDQIGYQTRLDNLPVEFQFPDTIRARISYDRAAGLLRYRGVMTTSDRDLLLEDRALVSLTTEQRPLYVAAVRALYDEPLQFTRRALAAFAYHTPLDAFPANLRIPPDMEGRLTYDAAAHTLGFKGLMTATERELLWNLSANTSYRSALDALFAAPNAAAQPTELVFMSEAMVRLMLDTTVASDRFAALLTRLQPYLRQMLGTSAVIQTLSEALGLGTDLLRPLLAQHLSSIRTAGQTMLADFLDTDFAGSSDEPPFAHVRAAYRQFSKVALLLSKFGVTQSELEWLFQPSGSGASGAINLNLLAHVGETTYRASDAYFMWARMLELFRLRDRFGSLGLVKVFALARQTPPDDAAITRAISDWGGWRIEDVRALSTHWRLRGEDFRDERSLVRLSAGSDLLRQLGVSAEECWNWTAPDFHVAESAQRVAEGIRLAVKAKYSKEQWLEVARPIRDGLRERQAAALVAYLIAHPPVTGRVWRTANDLYAYYLIDVEMSACQPTSRIRLAHSVVQLFVQRCLMNLETGAQADAGLDSGWRQWEWMKSYRVWEANRKIFLYPENWIEPELRDDKTDFFKDMENELLQDDLTAETAETAFMNYFEKLDTIGRLQICAMYRQPGDRTRTTLHVFGRTSGTPHVYYHRRHIRTNYASYWTPWEKVDVDIEGDYLIPVIWNDRLYLFWPTFLEQSEQPRLTMPEPNRQMEEPRKYTKMQMAWSQYRHNRWTPKTISKEFAKLPPLDSVELYFKALPTNGGDLIIRCIARITAAVMPLRLARPTGTLGSALGLPGGSGSILVPGAPRREEDLSFIRLRESTTRELDFRFTHSDGTIRRSPLINSEFIPVVRGTHLEGMTFVENDRRLQLTRTHLDGFVYFPLNAPEGRADVNGNWEQPARSDIALPPLSFQVGQTYLMMPEIYARGDDSLSVNMPALRLQTLLRRLPLRSDTPNLFRLSMPDNQLAETHEFFYQDNTRTFYGELKIDPEVMRLIQLLLRSVDPNDPGYAFFLGLIVGSVATGARKYQFHSHYHPYIRMLMQKLNREGVDALLQRPVQIAPHLMGLPPERFDFQSSYDPNLARVFADNLPVEEMDFSTEGAYAQYNWELFFHAPLLIADRLSKNQRFSEAQHWFHTIFDPSDMSDEDMPQRYWRTRPFFETSHETYQRERIDNLLRRLSSGDDDPELTNQIAQWRDNPFNPHLVARTRTTAFQKTVVMKYLDNLLAWGDQLFSQDTLESINEATQLYVLAAEILGPRPQRVERRAIPSARTYYQLLPDLDGFASALVYIENLTPRPSVRRASAEIVDSPPDNRPDISQPSSIEPPATRPALRLPSDLYFCIPPNDELLSYWDKVADRLFKIRHCMNIEGLVRQLPLFEPPIDPALLVRARALGVDLRSVLNERGATLPHYRFPVMLQKAAEMCAEVRGFGASLLAALEKRDAEEIALLRLG